MNRWQPSRRQALSGLVASLFAFLLPGTKQAVIGCEDGGFATSTMESGASTASYSYDCEDGRTISTTILTFSEFDEVVDVRHIA